MLYMEVFPKENNWKIILEQFCPALHRKNNEIWHKECGQIFAENPN